MVDKLRSSPEHQERGPAEKVEKKQDESRELREQSHEVGEGIAEVVEGVESAESAEVSETTGEDKKKGPQGKIPQTGGKKIAFDLKPIDFPKIEVMQIQIATAIKKEIAVLEQEAARVSDKPFELSVVVGKIRELKDMLSNLTHVTIETIKGWWMKFVKKSS